MNTATRIAVGIGVAWVFALGLTGQTIVSAGSPERQAARHVAFLELPERRDQAVRGLLALGAAAAPALCDKLTDPRPDVVARAAHCLRALGAGAEGVVPDLRILTASEVAHTATAARWVLSAFEPEGITLVTDHPGGRILEFDEAGKVLLEIKDLTRVFHAERLPNGHYLVALTSPKSNVREIDRNGAVVWTYSDPSMNALGVVRLPNDNTLIANASGNVIEVSPAGKVVRKTEARVTPWKAYPLPNGNLLIADGNEARELDWRGETLRTFDQAKELHDAQRLWNGHTLITSHRDNKVLEVDAAGRIVHTIETTKNPHTAIRVSNGDTIIGGRGFVSRRNERGVLVWKHDFGMTGCVRHY